MVPLPPRQAPRDRDHQRTLSLGRPEAIAHEQHHRQHGGGEGDVVNEGRRDGAYPEDKDDGQPQFPLGAIEHPVGDLLDEARGSNCPSYLMAVIREATVKFEGSFEPRAVLVFDEKYQLMGILTLRDIIIGLEPKFLQETSLIKMDPSLTVFLGDFFGPKLKEQSHRAVSEIMSPVKATINAEDPISKPLYLMIKENIGLIPVMQQGKVAGMLRLSDLFGEVSKIVLGD